MKYSIFLILLLNNCSGYSDLGSLSMLKNETNNPSISKGISLPTNLNTSNRPILSQAPIIYNNNNSVLTNLSNTPNQFIISNQPPITYNPNISNSIIPPLNTIDYSNTVIFGSNQVPSLNTEIYNGYSTQLKLFGIIVDSNTKKINNNTIATNNNQKEISKNYSCIYNNYQALTTNQNNISTNQNNISTNKDSISINENKLDRIRGFVKIQIDTLKNVEVNNLSKNISDINQKIIKIDQVIEQNSNNFSSIKDFEMLKNKLDENNDSNKLNDKKFSKNISDINQNIIKINDVANQNSNNFFSLIKDFEILKNQFEVFKNQVDKNNDSSKLNDKKFSKNISDINQKIIKINQVIEQNTDNLPSRKDLEILKNQFDTKFLKKDDLNKHTKKTSERISKRKSEINNLKNKLNEKINKIENTLTNSQNASKESNDSLNKKINNLKNKLNEKITSINSSEKEMNKKLLQQDMLISELQKNHNLLSTKLKQNEEILKNKNQIIDCLQNNILMQKNKLYTLEKRMIVLDYMNDIILKKFKINTNDYPNLISFNPSININVANQNNLKQDLKTNKSNHKTSSKDNSSTNFYKTFEKNYKKKRKKRKKSSLSPDNKLSTLVQQLTDIGAENINIKNGPEQNIVEVEVSDPLFNQKISKMFSNKKIKKIYM